MSLIEVERPKNLKIKYTKSKKDYLDYSTGKKIEKINL